MGIFYPNGYPHGLSGEARRIVDGANEGARRAARFESDVISSVVSGDGRWPDELAVAIMADRGHPTALGHMRLNGPAINAAIAETFGGNK